MQGRPLRVLLVDDHALFRKGLTALLRLDQRVEVVGEAANGLAALDAVRQVSPDAVLMDLHMPECGGVEACRRLRADGFEGGIVALTVSDADEDLFGALRAGATCYVLKDADLEEVVLGLTCACRGDSYIAPHLASRIVSGIRHDDAPATRRGKERAGGLTEREEQVLAMIASGAGNREIGAELFLSEHTVKSHVKNILRKLQLTSRREAIAYAARSGLKSENRN
jgi:DNA-binding NarL/FixJ family response regulator